MALLPGLVGCTQVTLQEMKEFFAGDSAALVDYYPPRGWYGIGGKSCRDQVESMAGKVSPF